MSILYLIHSLNLDVGKRIFDTRLTIRTMTDGDTFKLVILSSRLRRIFHKRPKLETWNQLSLVIRTALSLPTFETRLRHF